MNYFILSDVLCEPEAKNLGNLEDSWVNAFSRILTRTSRKQIKHSNNNYNLIRTHEFPALAGAGALIAFSFSSYSSKMGAS